MCDEVIKIKDITDIFSHERYIKYKCGLVTDVFITGIYFKDKNNPDGCSTKISFFGHPNKVEIETQKLLIKAINAACNTAFELYE